MLLYFRGMKYTKQNPINTWALEDRPREKLLHRGIGSLTDAELLAIIIGNGTVGSSALDLAREIIKKFGSLKELSRATVHELKHVRGIGGAKAIAILSAFELCRRKSIEENQVFRVTSPSKVADYLKPRLADLRQEVFYILFLNRANEIIAEKVLSTGGVSSTVIDPRVIFKEAVNYLASSIMVSHNHPSGNTKPSQQDIVITQKLKEGGKILDIVLLDHIIITDRGYFSFSDEGMI